MPKSVPEVAEQQLSGRDRVGAGVVVSPGRGLPWPGLVRPALPCWEVAARAGSGGRRARHSLCVQT